MPHHLKSRDIKKTRVKHHCLWYEEMLGYYTDGYNGMNCSAIYIDDSIAEDFELVYGEQNDHNNI